MPFPIDNDAQLVLIVRHAGRDGPEYRYLKDALREAGLGSLVRMGHRRVLLELRARGILVPMPAPPDFVNEIPTIRLFAVSAALETFMGKQVMEGGWDPTGGASLRTYFAKSVLYAFAAEYRRYYREEWASRETSHADMRDVEARLPIQRNGDPEITAIDRDLIRRVLPEASDVVVNIVMLTAEGFTQIEIGKHYGMSPAAISSVLRRFRNKLRHKGYVRYG